MRLFGIIQQLLHSYLKIIFFYPLYFVDVYKRQVEHRPVHLVDARIIGDDGIHMHHQSNAQFLPNFPLGFIHHLMRVHDLLVAGYFRVQRDDSVERPVVCLLYTSRCV